MTAYIVRDGDAKLTDIEMKNYLKGKNLLSLILCEDSSSPFYRDDALFILSLLFCYTRFCFMQRFSFNIRPFDFLAFTLRMCQNILRRRIEKYIYIYMN